MLTTRFSRDDLAAALVSPENYSPFPRAEERTAWETLPESLRAMWIGLAEAYADYSWPALAVSGYRNYWRIGNIAYYMKRAWERRSVLGFLVMAECMEGQGRFLDAIIDGIFAICEETSWVTPGHRLHSKINLTECMPDESDHMVELMTVSTSDLLVWTRYLLGRQLDEISPRIGGRIEKEVRRRLLVPYAEHNDYWWLGFQEGVRVNNWNPWCNNCVLMAALLLEQDANKRADTIYKVMRSLDVFIRTYPADGCCDEGPMYWGASGGGLYSALEMLSDATEGKVEVFDDPLIQDIGRYIYKTHISDDYFVAFADGDARAGRGGDGIYRYGKAIGDQHMMRLGATRTGGKPGLHTWFGLYGHIRSLFSENERENVRAVSGDPYIRDAWMPVTQVMIAREREGGAEGLYLAAKGGTNIESHNHNDVGSFIVFVDGHPLIVDLGTEEYRAKTFGPDRYDLWYLQSQYHNLPTVRGVQQKAGDKYRAGNTEYRMEERFAELSLDIAGAYTEEAGIVEWRRRLRLERAEESTIELTDTFILQEPAAEIFFSLMTPHRPLIDREGRIRLEYATDCWAVIVFESQYLEAKLETIDFMDSRLKRNCGELMYRIVLREKQPVISGIRVLRIQADR